MEEKGVSIQEHIIEKIDAHVVLRVPDRKKVDRPQAAIARSGFSKPVQILFEYGLLSQDSTLFDYGCQFRISFLTTFPNQRIKSSHRTVPAFSEYFFVRSVIIAWTLCL